MTGNHPQVVKMEISWWLAWVENARRCHQSSCNNHSWWWLSQWKCPAGCRCSLRAVFWLSPILCESSHARPLQVQWPLPWSYSLSETACPPSRHSLPSSIIYPSALCFACVWSCSKEKFSMPNRPSMTSMKTFSSLKCSWSWHCGPVGVSVIVNKS